MGMFPHRAVIDSPEAAVMPLGRIVDPDSLLPSSLLTPEEQVPDDGDGPSLTGAHAQSAHLADLLERIARGRAAAALLPPDARTAVGTVVVWPLFALRAPIIDVGRKATSGRYHPVRIDHGGRELVESLLNDEIEQVRICRVIGLGHDAEETVTGRIHRGRDAERVLLAFVEDGQQALWDFRAEMEPIIARYVAEANASLHMELKEFWGLERAPRPLDEVMVDQVQMAMLYGKLAEPSPVQGRRVIGQDRVGSVDRLIEKILGDPRSLAKVDLIMLLTRTLRRDAWQEVRSLLGDPRAGSKIRRASIELGTRDVRAVHARYIAEHPADSRISLARVAKALTLRPGSIPLDVSDDLIQDLLEHSLRREADS